MIDMDDPEVIESLKYLTVTEDDIDRAERVYKYKFNPVKNFFALNDKEGCLPVTIVTEDDKKGCLIVKTRESQLITVLRENTAPMNHPKFEKTEDMAQLPQLNNATILHNLRQRYSSWLIYTYSGLFCIAINPYRSLPIYTMNMVWHYRGKKKDQVPPHLYLVADNAFTCMQRDRKNQSLLITGESGAGKTENTKKVIQYFALVANSIKNDSRKEQELNKPSLEDQIVSANPVLEAYGNAKTTRNNNSSRFGKFIRIHFTNLHSIAGADIEAYLLEKSRVTFCMSQERNYHIFYQLLSNAFPDMLKELLIEADPSKYHFINQGMLTVDNVNDADEMKSTKKAFDTLGFTQDQQLDLFKSTAAIAIFGNTQWKQRPKDDQAEPEGETNDLGNVASLLGIDEAELTKSLTKPKLKVGNEFVHKGQNVEQVTNSVAAMCKAIYSRGFNWIVSIVNENLNVKTMRKSHYIGVLDIAGFETFDFNGFEQLCINYTNERLQQFFNNFMFVMEQEEYLKEAISWEEESFGADLQATIDLIEKPLGILSILEEECILPKATEKTFKEKLFNHHSQHNSFGKSKAKKGEAESDFDLFHYAGIVSYRVDGWLEKNKDPMNQSVAMLLKHSKDNKLMSLLFQDIGIEETNGKRGKSSIQQTISSGHREQLNKLMNMLKTTYPHFVRCIIPNETKTAGVMDAKLVLHQLHCNGVLEGIRISRKGFPSRMTHSDFLQRYSFISSSSSDETDVKTKCSNVLTGIELETELYRVGSSKVLFKTGVLGKLEELRDVSLAKKVLILQCHFRRYLANIEYTSMKATKQSLQLLQQNLKVYLQIKSWAWLKFFQAMLPMIALARQEEERLAFEEAERKKKEMEDELKRLDNERRAALVDNLEANYSKLEKERDELLNEVAMLNDRTINNQKLLLNLTDQKCELQSVMEDLQDSLSGEKSKTSDLSLKKKELELEIDYLNDTITEFQARLIKVESELHVKSEDNQKMSKDLVDREDCISNLTKEKKRVEQSNEKLIEQLHQEEDKTNQLNKLKAQLQLELATAEEVAEKEKREKAEFSRVIQKQNGEFKAAQDSIEQLTNANFTMEDMIKKKDTEVVNLTAACSQRDEELIVLEKHSKEVSNNLAEIQSQFEFENMAKLKSEKQRKELTIELDALYKKMQGACDATSIQVELNMKYEQDLKKMKQEMDSMQKHFQLANSQLVKKNQESVKDFNEQIELLSKEKAKLEKEKVFLNHEIEETKQRADESNKQRLDSERLNKALEKQLQELNFKFNELKIENDEIIGQKLKSETENTNLKIHLEQNESQIESLVKSKSELTSQVDDLKQIVADEETQKNAMSVQLKYLQKELCSFKAKLEEEESKRNDAQFLLSRTDSELQRMKLKCKCDSVEFIRIELLEQTKKRFTHKLNECQSDLVRVQSKCDELEKVKQNSKKQIEELNVTNEDLKANVIYCGKKQKQAEKLVTDWKEMCEKQASDLEGSQNALIKSSVEINTLKAQIDDMESVTAVICRENKNLGEANKDLTNDISLLKVSEKENEKLKNLYQNEKADLQSNLDSVSRELQNVEAKRMATLQEVSNVKQELSNKLNVKDEELVNLKRNHQRAIEALQVSLDIELKNKEELANKKKKLETATSEALIELDEVKETNSELQITTKRSANKITDLQSKLEASERLNQGYAESAAIAERRANTITAEMNEVNSSRQAADKSRKDVIIEVKDLKNKLLEANMANASMINEKRKLNESMAAMQREIEDTYSNLRYSDEKFKNANHSLSDALARLKQQKDELLTSEMMKKNLENQITTLQENIFQLETSNNKNYKREIEIVEQKNKELITELENQTLYNHEMMRKVKKNDRKFKDLAMVADEEKLFRGRLELNIDELNAKVKCLKSQLEDTEQQSSDNLSKLRRMQSDYNTATMRADNAENQLANFKTRSRVSVQRDLGSIDESSYSSDYNRASVGRSSVGRSSVTREFGTYDHSERRMSVQRELANTDLIVDRMTRRMSIARD